MQLGGGADKHSEQKNLDSHDQARGGGRGLGVGGTPLAVTREDCLVIFYFCILNDEPKKTRDSK